MSNYDKATGLQMDGEIDRSSKSRFGSRRADMYPVRMRIYREMHRQGVAYTHDIFARYMEGGTGSL